jgi:hypothetical protein
MLETREGGCHCGRVRFRAEVDLDLLSHCSCSVCTKKGILHLGTDPATFQLLRGKSALTSYTFGTGVAQILSARSAACTPSTSRGRSRTASSSMPAASTTSTGPA